MYREETPERLLYRTKEFWDTNPCDGQKDIFDRMRFRYEKEPWLPPVLEEIAQFKTVLEIGCGQGTDAIYCCQRISKDSTYFGVDLSEKSIENARRAIEHVQNTLQIHPHLATGNAESLDFDDQTFDCVFSNGVLHHTPNLEKALSEIYRVLKTDGVAILSLYRRFSPKVLGAYGVRFLSKCIDKIASSEYLLLGLFRNLGSDHFWGTMLLECIGVPILRSYTKNDLRKRLSSFHRVEIRSVAIGFRLFGLNKHLEKNTNIWGSLYLVKAYK